MKIVGLLVVQQSMAQQTKGTGHIDQSIVEDLGGIAVIRGGGDPRGWNGILYKQGMSAKNVGSQGLSINVATVPPGAVAYAHIHDGFEVMLFILQGQVKHTFGEGLKEEVINSAGDFIYIKPGVPHEVFNIGQEELIVFVARSAADEWDKIVNYPSSYRPG
ncbi:MAG: cupin domain-containing protein [Thermaceae bacterium]|nr:cupin domain-containing protein [Thermaceae bacterium]